MTLTNSNNDYFPFGQLLPNRHKAEPDYRYGFNGEEVGNEVKGQANSVNYKARIYDPRLGKFLSVDPITHKFPMLTPYQFASNMPIWGVDLDGLEARIYTDLTKGLPHTFI